MKWLYTMLLLIVIVGMTHKGVAATPKKITCSYHGQFKHTESDTHLARKSTTDACFESQMELFESKRGNLPDDEQAEYIIESCLNETVCS
jgi:hypothetical protein